MVYHFARNFFNSTQRAELTFNGVIISDIHKKEIYEIPYSQIVRIYLGISRGKSRKYFCEITDNNNYITTIFSYKAHSSETTYERFITELHYQCKDNSNIICTYKSDSPRYWWWYFVMMPLNFAILFAFTRFSEYTMPYGLYIFLMLMIITLFGFKKGKATYKIDKIPTFMFP